MADGASKLATAISDAQSIIAAAERRAEELRQRTEAALTEASQRGFQEGLEAGRQEAVKQAVRLLEDAGVVGDRIAKEAAKLALAIASKVVGEHIKVDPQLVQRLAVRALQESIVGDTVTLIVNPEDQAIIEQFRAQLRAVTGGFDVTIEVRGELARGGCIVKTEFGEVDASIESLLKEIGSRLGIENPKNAG